MLIAHLPAGYLLSRLHPALRHHTAWVMIGAILPDVDLFYLYLWDGGSTHHHSYLTHRPALWLGLLLLSVTLTKPRPPLRALALGGLLHVALDTLAGAIAWGWPIWQVASPLVVVPATHDWWVMSFLTHWTFGLELLICAIAATVFLNQRVHKSRPLERPR